jgi:hypothetical protein
LNESPQLYMTGAPLGVNGPLPDGTLLHGATCPLLVLHFVCRTGVAALTLKGGGHMVPPLSKWTPGVKRSRKDAPPQARKEATSPVAAARRNLKSKSPEVRGFAQSRRFTEAIFTE